MPHKPPRPCAFGGCPALTHERYCPAHRQYGYAPDLRPSAARRGYDAEWRKIRLEVLEREPYCRQCGRPASDVDHIIPRRQGGTNDHSNLQPLCINCHRSKTRRESLQRQRRR